MAKSYRDIMLLLRAGYSKTEIDAMTDEELQDEPNTQTEQKPTEPVNVPQGPTSAPVEPVQPVPQPASDMDKVLQQLSALTAAIQGNNLAYAEMGAEIIDPQQTAVNVLRGMGGIPNPHK